MKHYSYYMIGLLALIGIIIFVFTKSSDDIDITKLEFCNVYPNSLFCVDDNATKDDVVADNFLYIIQNYPNSLNDNFCHFYFAGRISNYCIEDLSMIFPNDFSDLSSSFDVLNVGNDLYDIRTIYKNGDPAYTFRIALNTVDDFYTISGFSYIIREDNVELNWSSEELNDFIIQLLQSYNDSDNVTFCSTYFTWRALEQCKNGIDSLGLKQGYTYNYIVNDIGNNEFEYIASNDDLSSWTKYLITIELEDQLPKISSFNSMNYNP